ncbi:unnamed protein product [Rhizoctonia solani]|uniref:Uncharacterized protein n=1 Tax=Rhizoctonia solani TaxID=456999 RepID=A0A8H3C6C4_9AGAM|nr:unnamed protein product [Rhizoctonia solani]
MGPTRTKHSSNRYDPWNLATRHEAKSTTLSPIPNDRLEGNEVDQPCAALVRVEPPGRLEFPPDYAFTTQPQELVVRQPSVSSDAQDIELNESFRVGTVAVQFIRKMMFDLPYIHEVVGILEKLGYKSDHASTSRDTTTDPDLDKIMRLSLLLRNFDQEMDKEFPWLPKALHALRQLSVRMEGDDQDSENDTLEQNEGEDDLRGMVPRNEVPNNGAEAEEIEDTLMLSGSVAGYKVTRNIGDPDSQMMYTSTAAENPLLGFGLDTYSQYSTFHNLETPTIVEDAPTVLGSGYVPSASSQNLSSSSSRDGLLPLNVTTAPTPVLLCPQKTKASLDNVIAPPNRYSITCVAPGVSECTVKLELDITIRPPVLFEDSDSGSPS